MGIHLLVMKVLKKLKRSHKKGVIMNEDIYGIVFTIYAVIVIIGIFLGFGEQRKVIIFRDYDDLGLTFLIPASFFLILYVFSSFGVSQKFSLIIGGGVALILTFKLLKDTYLDNNSSIKFTFLAFFTKMPLAVIWVLNFINMLNPSGKTARQRSSSRQTSMVILAILTPILAALVVEKEGSFFNPQSWIRGRRVGNIRNHL